MREKLIELLANKLVWGVEYTAEPKRIENEELADYLIANGVTVQKWIPVTERLPEERDANARGYVLAIAKFDGCINAWAYHAVSRVPNAFTHWMPLPEQPKGE